MNILANKRSAQTGFSLVELMIALTLGLLLTASIGALFYANKKSYTENNLIAAMQDNSRFAIQALSRDLQMSGFYGGMLGTGSPELISTTIPTLISDCGPGTDGVTGWALDGAPIELINDVTPANVPDVYSCLSAGDILARTDILAVRRVSGRATDRIDDSASTTAPTLAPNVFYLRTNGTDGGIFFSADPATNPDSGPAEKPPNSFWEYFVRLYFIRPYAVTPGDGIPTLCRAYLKNQAAPTVDIESLAEGVEDMQIAFGIKTGNTLQYMTAPTPDQLNNAVTARIQLLMRSRDPDYSYTNNKSYNIIGKDDDGDGVVDETSTNPEEIDGYRPQDHFYRRIVETTVILRNPASQSAIQP